MQIDVAEYYKKYGPMVLRRCRSMLVDEDKALDAMQDVFVKLIENKNKLKGTYPSSLLYRIATNICLNMIRYEKARPSLENADLLMNIAGSEEMEKKIAARDFLERIFSSEKPSTREIAVLHYVDGMTLQEVADTVGMSMSGIRKRLRNLKAKVNCLGESI
ncbi:MAG: sigma-70 family RNA polymerase sigma factor [Spirochaetes bacterium]|nr:sigma-70 family RNA polymerase sigma factor [Spirochaetota bacterium]